MGERVEGMGLCGERDERRGLWGKWMRGGDCGERTKGGDCGGNG